MQEQFCPKSKNYDGKQVRCKKYVNRLCERYTVFGKPSDPNTHNNYCTDPDEY